MPREKTIPKKRGPKPIIGEKMRAVSATVPEDAYRILIERSRAQGVPLSQIIRDVLMRSVLAELERSTDEKR